MQAHNGLKGLNQNVLQYLNEMFLKVLGDKKCIPDQVEYAFLANKNTEPASLDIIPDNWEEQTGIRIEEWESEIINAYAIEMNDKKNIFYDPYRRTLFLSQAF